MRRSPTCTVSIRMPPTLRPMASAVVAEVVGAVLCADVLPTPAAPRASSSRSLGHLMPSRGGWPGCGGSSASARARPTASDRPDQSAGASGSASEKVSDAPALDSQALPCRPRPRVWCSATSRQGWVSAWRRPGRRSVPAALSSSPSREWASPRGRFSRRERSSNSVLVEAARATTSTLKPGSRGASCCHSVSAPQCKWGVAGRWGRGGMGAGRLSEAHALDARAVRLGASIVPRQLLLPQRHSKRFFSAGV